MIMLPEKLELVCPACSSTFFVLSADIDGLEHIACPFCEQKSLLLDTLSTEIRLLIYRELREEIEKLALDQS